MHFLFLLMIPFSFSFVLSCEIDGDKLVNESCNSDSQCYNGQNQASVACKSGRCTCNEGYLAQLQWFTPKEQRLVCVSAPYEGQPCTTLCQKPYSCAQIGNTALKTCQCLPPFSNTNGLCSMVCKSGEIFEFGECRRRCENNEIKSPNGLCKKLSKLGERCEFENQCSVPFSSCVSGVCTCENGFAPNPNKDACESKLLWCPFGDPIRLQNKVIQCKVIRKQEQSSAKQADFLPFPPIRQVDLKDNCDDDQFCMLTSGEGFYAEGATGHCCARPKLACPIGQPHQNATCDPPFLAAGHSPAPYCPYESHSCIYFAFGGGYQKSICCPKICGSDQILINGRCLPRRNHGDHCEIDDQCKGHSGICLDGKCTCGKDFETQGANAFQYCRKVCNSDQVLINDRCSPKLKFGQPCDQQVFGQCPVGAVCSRGKCDCPCGHVRLSDEVCALQPTCPLVVVSPPNGPVDTRVTASSFVLCRVPGGQNSSMAPVVDKCPDGHYCSIYEPQYGFCCPVPEEPFCPLGSKPGPKCDPKKPDACGPSSFCHRYINPVGQEDTGLGYVCCPSVNKTILR